MSLVKQRLRWMKRVSFSSVAFKLLEVAKSSQNTHDRGLLATAHRAWRHAPRMPFNGIQKHLFLVPPWCLLWLVVGTELVHVEVARFDLVLSGACGKESLKGLKNTTRCLGPRGDGSRNTKSIEIVQEKKMGKLTGQRSDQWMPIDTQKETERSTWSLFKSMGCSRTEGPLAY